VSTQPTSGPAPAIKVWWEKTVEYKFVLAAMPKLAEAFPLDGNEEKHWIDLLLREGEQFRLIEFKRSNVEIAKEKDKFPFMRGNKDDEFHTLLTDKKYEALPKEPGFLAHWLIYGSLEEGFLKLRFRQYGEGEDDKRSLSAPEDLKGLTSVDHVSMRSYLVALQEARGHGGSSSSGTHVLGVTNEDRPRLISVKTFLALKPTPSPQHDVVQAPAAQAAAVGSDPQAVPGDLADPDQQPEPPAERNRLRF